MNDYPARPKFFANKFCRLLTKSAAALTLGPEVCWLLTIIVMQEDAVQYKRPVNFWNEQLMTLCGFGSKKRLVTARDKAVKAGWLNYEQGDRLKPGVYWVANPTALTMAESGGCDEADFSEGIADHGGTNRNGKASMGVRNGTANGTDGLFGGNETERQTAPKRNGKSAPSIPNPKPIPKDKRFSYSEDFETFWQVFPKGRKSGKKASFKSWQQAIKDAEPKLIIDAARDYAASDVGRGQYVKGPTPWLNQGCWDDDRAAWSDKPDRKPSEPVYKDLTQQDIA